MTHIYNDGNKNGRYQNETNDCTVRAYAIAANIPYANAHAELFLFGRKNRHGINFIPFARSKGWKEYPRPSMEVDSYVKYIALTGRWIIAVRGHVFAVVDGTIHDTIRLSKLVNRHVTHAWRLDTE